MKPDDVHKKLAELRRLDRRFQVFGASGHRYALRPPLTDRELAAAETQFGVSFPEDYASFLTEIGAGGAGPSYGIFPLVVEGRTWKWLGDGADLTEDLASPFPHAAPWNLDGHPVWDAEPTEEGSPSEEAFDEANSAWQDTIDALLWDPRWTRGAICLCHLGCALREWLVVSGPERGNLWYDGRADYSGLGPTTRAGLERVTFAQWYEHWLEEALESARTLPAPSASSGWSGAKRWPRT
jgi:hypothetical protein